MIRGGLYGRLSLLERICMQNYTHATIKKDIYRNNEPNILAGTHVQVSYMLTAFNRLYNRQEAVYTVTLPDGEKANLYANTLTDFREVAL